MWVGVGVGFVLVPLFCCYFIVYISLDAIQGIPIVEYRSSILLIGLSIGLELCSEPMFVIAQAQLEYSHRSKLKALAVLVKCVVTIIAAIVLGYHLEAFAFGYVAHSLTLLIGYYSFFHKQFNTNVKHNSFVRVRSFKELIPQPARFNELVKTKSFVSATVFTKQTVLKLLLSEGEKMVMVANALSPSEQATYGIVFNLGSLFARFLFELIEEVAYTVFGKLNDISKRHDQPPQDLTLAQLLSIMCKLMSLIGLSIASFGPSYAHILFRILFGTAYSSSAAPNAFGWYCFYLLVIAINGITEAFVHAVGTQVFLNQFNRWLVVCSGVYLTAAMLLVQHGVLGMIAANCINMVLRISYSVQFILNWKDTSDPSAKPPVSTIRMLLPKRRVIAFFLLSFVVTKWSELEIYREFVSLQSVGVHILIGGACFVLCIGCVYLEEKELLNGLSELVKVVNK